MANDFDKMIGDVMSINAKDADKSWLNINPFAFTNEVLYWCQMLGLSDVTNLKLQKLLYYCYAIASWKLDTVLFDPIIKDNDKDKYVLDFFPLGPVIVPVYEGFKHYGNMVIAKDVESFKKASFKTEQDPNSENPEFIKYELRNDSNKASIVNAIKYTLVALGDVPANKLVDMTHVPKKSAWDAFYHHKNKKTNQSMTSKIFDEIHYYKLFRDLYDKNIIKYQ